MSHDPEPKRALRRAMRERLAEIGPGERTARSRAAAARLLSMPDLPDPGGCMAFASMPDEIDTSPLIDALLRTGWRVALPRVDPDEGTMAAYWIESTGGLPVNRWGIPEPEPNPDLLAAAAPLSLIVVPGLAFDASGSRLGRAGGYYDRFLRDAGKGPLRVGLFYSIQQLPEIPTEPWDEPLDVVVTDACVIRCHPPARDTAPRSDPASPPC